MGQRNLRKQRAGSAFFAARMLFGLAGSLTGCGSIEPVAPAAAPITDPTELYMQLALDHRAVTISAAPGHNTMQFTATPRDALGNPMPGLPMPTFVSKDTTKVTVSADGLVTALAATGSVNVIASLTVGPVTHADTVQIQVTSLESPPTLASLSIHPLPPDSTIWPWQPGDVGLAGLAFSDLPGFGSGLLPQAKLTAPRILDMLGSSVTGLLIEYTSLDSTIVAVGRREGSVTVLRPGQARIVASATAYGTTIADTVTYTVTQPLAHGINISPGPTGTPIFASRLGTPGSLKDAVIAPYGMVVWYNYLGDTVDVTFDDPTNVVRPPDVLCNSAVPLFYAPGACGAGNILVPVIAQSLDPSFLPGDFSMRIRQFPIPGVYPFHSTRLGISARVVVTTNPNGTP